MQVAVIGPLEVRRAGSGPVPLAGAEARLLAVLTVHAPRAVDVERLVQPVWNGDPPPDPQRALHALVVGVRGALEPGLPPNTSGRYLLRRGGGYLLSLPRAEIDALRFTDLVERGRARLGEGDVAEARRTLSAALQLWRGEPYLDWPGAAFAEAERRRLTALRGDAEAALVEARSRPVAEAPLPRPVVAEVRRTPVRGATTEPRFAPEPRARTRLDLPAVPPRRPEPAPVPGTPEGDSRRFVLVAAFLVVAMLVAVLAIRAQQTAVGPPAAAEVRDPRDDAERLADLSAIQGPLDTSLLLAAQAVRMEESAEMRNALRAALMAHPRADRVGRIPGTPQGVALSGSGTTLVVVTYLDVVAWEVDDPDPPRLLMSIPRDWGFWWAVIPSPTGDVVAAAGRSDGGPWVRMISTGTGRSRLLPVGDSSDGAPLDGAMTPDGNRVLLLVAEPVGRAPDITTRWKVLELDAEDGSVRETGILGDFDAPTGALAVDFADDAGSFVLWDRTSDAATLVDLGERSQRPLAVGTDRTGTLGWRALGSGAARLGADGDITLVDGTGAPIQVLREHEAPVMDVAVSPDGTWAASAGDGLPDGELYRWDVDPATGRWSSPETLSGHSGAVVDVEVDGTGQRLVSISGDTTAISWRMGADAGTAGAVRSMDASELLATACAIAGRDLTEGEWERYLPDRPYRPTCTDLAPR